MLQSRHSLERHKFFPYIAWSLVLGFSLFVYTIVQDLRVATAELSVITERLERNIATPPSEIFDFNH